MGDGARFCDCNAGAPVDKACDRCGGPCRNLWEYDSGLRAGECCYAHCHAAPPPPWNEPPPTPMHLARHVYDGPARIVDPAAWDAMETRSANDAARRDEARAAATRDAREARRFARE